VNPDPRRRDVESLLEPHGFDRLSVLVSGHRPSTALSLLTAPRRMHPMASIVVRGLDESVKK